VHRGKLLDLRLEDPEELHTPYDQRWFSRLRQPAPHLRQVRTWMSSPWARQRRIPDFLSRINPWDLRKKIPGGSCGRVFLPRSLPTNDRVPWFDTGGPSSACGLLRRSGAQADLRPVSRFAWWPLLRPLTRLAPSHQGRDGHGAAYECHRRTMIPGLDVANIRC